MSRFNAAEKLARGVAKEARQRPRVVPWSFPADEERMLSHVFKWLAAVGASAFGHELDHQSLYGRPLVECRTCGGTGLKKPKKLRQRPTEEPDWELRAAWAGCTAEQAKAADVAYWESQLEPVLGDQQCGHCSGTGQVQATPERPIPTWYEPPTADNPLGCRNVSGTSSWVEEVVTKGSSVPQEPSYEVDASEYAWIGLQLSRLLAAERDHGVLPVSALQSWYGPDARRYDPEEVPIGQDVAIRVLRGAHEARELLLPDVALDQLEDALQQLLRAYQVEDGHRRDAERDDEPPPEWSSESRRVGELLLPKRAERADQLARIDALCGLWPATETGRSELRGEEPSRGFREHVASKRGGTRLVAKLDREAERLLKRAQEVWLETGVRRQTNEQKTNWVAELVDLQVRIEATRKAVA